MTDNRFTNQKYLREEQYKDSSNLTARADLHKRFSSNPYGFHRWVFDMLKLSAQSRVLEIGCGPGMLWTSNLHHIPVDCIITLTDLSIGMVEQAQRNLSVSNHNFAFAVGDAQALPFSDANFDVVIANHMLYHVPEIRKALSEIRRTLKPGGRFYAATNGEGHMRELGDLAHSFSPQAPLLGTSFANTFTLENGSQQLERFFSDVTLHRYDDGLVVNEAAPLVAYVRSTSVGADFDEEKFTRFVGERLAASGPIHITKDTGLFEAYKGETDGLFALNIENSDIDSISDKLRDELVEHDQTLEKMLQALREQRAGDV